MDTIEHFGHKQHPLIYRKHGDHNIKALCNMCDLPILSSPSYICIHDCKFFLHEPCARLPAQVTDPYISKLLSLENNPYPSSPCRRCDKLCTNFVYTPDFNQYYEDYIVHPLCAVKVEILIEHPSHNEHPLVAVCRETVSRCDACGERHLGSFFSCRECNFWVHRDCTLLPSIAKHPSHAHLLVLTYALSTDFYRAHIWSCYVCGGRFRGKGIYACAVDRDYLAHLRCVMPHTGNFSLEEKGLFMHLPHHGGGYTFSSLSFRNLDERQADILGRENKWPIEGYHHHPLILHNIISGDHEGTTNASSNSNSREGLLMSYSCSLDQGAVCDACIQPIISTPFWGCIRPDCHFLLHDFCANIPSALAVFGYVASLYQNSSKYFINTFPCFFCHRPCNGLGYRANLYSYTIGIADLECASAPIATTHASHDRHDHILLLTMQIEAIPVSCCRQLWPPDPSSFQPSYSRTYRCISCNFAIHAGCALLPRKARHYKFDQHPLELMFTEFWTRKDTCLCEVCEQDIDQQYWFYHCAECEQSFHIQCIPSVGLLSKVKFGATLEVCCCPGHPMALTRMLMVGSQRCGYCKETIKGFVDEMSFYCSRCELWVHYLCAEECIKAKNVSRLWYDGRI